MVKTKIKTRKPKEMEPLLNKSNSIKFELDKNLKIKIMLKFNKLNSSKKKHLEAQSHVVLLVLPNAPLWCRQRALDRLDTGSANSPRAPTRPAAQTNHTRGNVRPHTLTRA